MGWQMPPGYANDHNLHFFRHTFNLAIYLKNVQKKSFESGAWTQVFLVIMLFQVGNIIDHLCSILQIPGVKRVFFAK